MKKPVKKMRRDRVYCRLAGGDNVIVCRVDHKTRKVTKRKECKYVTLDGDGPLLFLPPMEEIEVGPFNIDFFKKNESLT